MRIDGSTSGARPWRARRDWSTPNAASVTTPPASRANDQAGQPCSRPSISGYTSAKPPTIASVTLGASRRSARRGRRGAGQVAPAGGDREQAERDVDEEDRAPAGAEQVEVDQPAADQRPGDGGQAHDRAEHAERLLLALVAEQLADQPEALRHHDRGHRALERAAARSARSAVGASEHSTEATDEAADADEQHPAATRARRPAGCRAAASPPSPACRRRRSTRARRTSRRGRAGSPARRSARSSSRAGPSPRRRGPRRSRARRAELAAAPGDGRGGSESGG